MDSLHGCPNKLALIEVVNEFKSKGYIRECECIPDEYMNRLFLRPKPNGKFRPILNITKLNNFIRKEKFKMESLSQVLKMVEPNEFMCTIDLEDAFPSIPINNNYWNLFRFCIGGQHYKFVRLCFGLTVAPYVFTKMVKVVYTYI